MGVRDFFSRSLERSRSFDRSRSLSRSLSFSRSRSLSLLSRSLSLLFLDLDDGEVDPVSDEATAGKHENSH